MTTLLDLYNQKSAQEKQAIKRMIESKQESCDMARPLLEARGYSEERINWTLARL